MRDAHTDLYKKKLQLESLVLHMTDLQELADTVYALKETIKFIEDIRTQLRGLEELGIKIACALWLRDEKAEPIRTEYVTASPDVKTMVSIPKPGQPGYLEFMAQFGITEAMANADVVRPHWPGMIEYVSQQLQAGKPLPVGTDLSKTYSIFKLTCRGKKGVDA